MKSLREEAVRPRPSLDNAQPNCPILRKYKEQVTKGEAALAVNRIHFAARFPDRNHFFF